LFYQTAKQLSGAQNSKKMKVSFKIETYNHNTYHNSFSPYEIDRVEEFEISSLEESKQRMKEVLGNIPPNFSELVSERVYKNTICMKGIISDNGIAIGEVFPTGFIQLHKQSNPVN